MKRALMIMAAMAAISAPAMADQALATAKNCMARKSSSAGYPAAFAHPEDHRDHSRRARVEVEFDNQAVLGALFGEFDANLVLIEDEVLPFDAIEFNDELRWIDVASDMAFCWMDLLDHGQPGLANALLSEWLDASGDVSAPSVWSFFASYRAGVRAKVAAIRAGQQTGSPDADASLAEARRYLALAQVIALPRAPQLVISHGLSGSG